MSDELGFKTKVDIGEAKSAFAQLETSITRLERAMNGVSQRGGIQIIEERGFDRSIANIENALKGIEGMGREVTRRIDQEWNALASSTTRHASIISSAIIGALSDVDRQLLATEKRMDALAQANMRTFHTTGGRDLFSMVAQTRVDAGHKPPMLGAGSLVGATGAASLALSAGQAPRLAHALTLASQTRFGGPSAAGAFGGSPFVANTPLPPHIARIEKMLSLGQGSGHEAATANAMAQQMMAKHNVTAAQVQAAVAAAGGAGGGGRIGGPPPVAGYLGPGGGGVPHNMALVPYQPPRPAPPPAPPAPPAPHEPEERAHPIRNFMGGVAGALGGAASMIGLGGVVAYIASAVRDTAEESVRISNMNTRMGGGRSALGYEGMALPLGRGNLFTRAETLDMAESYKAQRGTVRSGGTNPGDVLALLGFTRGFGMEAGDVGSRFGGMGNAGIFKGGDAKRFSQEMAAAINQQGMMPRAAEAMEATASVLEDVASRIGDLTSADRRGMMAFQATLAQGSEIFRGARGAQMVNRMSGAIAPGEDEYSNTIVNMALVRGGKGNLSPFQLMELREKGASAETMGLVGKGINSFAGAKPEDRMELFRRTFHTGYSQTREIYGLTKGFTNFGNPASINAAAGKQIIDSGNSKQETGKAQEVRSVQLAADDFRKKVGETFFPVFKTIQSGLLGVANFVGDKIFPAIQSAWKGLAGLAGDIAKNGIMPIFKRLETELESLFERMEEKLFPGSTMGKKLLDGAADFGSGLGATLSGLMPSILSTGTMAGSGQSETPWGWRGDLSGNRPNFVAKGTAQQAQRFAALARTFDGKRYVTSGGHGTYAGKPIDVDCSGLVDQIAMAVGLQDLALAGTADKQGLKGKPVDLKNLKPGDLVYRLIRGRPGENHQGITHYDKEGFGLDENGKRLFGHVGVVTGYNAKGVPLVTQAGSSKGQVFTAPISNGAWDAARRNFDTDGVTFGPAGATRPGTTPNGKLPPGFVPPKPRLTVDDMAPTKAPVQHSALPGGVTVIQQIAINGGDPMELRRTLRGAAKEAWEQANSQSIGRFTAG